MTEFDIERFTFAIETVRKSKRLTQKQVAAQSGVSKPTLDRIQAGKKPDVDTAARLFNWSGLDFRTFILTK